MEFEEKKQQEAAGPIKKSNSLPVWGNEKSMNLNPLILTNIQSSQYFKVNLYQLKTYHEVIDEIYYNVNHLEPWEKGSRKTSGQTGMCGGVRGVGAGGIVSTAFCILYKLFTLRLTRKQVLGLINHGDSPYIRGLGFMYIRYTQPPVDLWEWLEPYLDDEEEIDVRAGGGQVLTVGAMVRHMLTKLEWQTTLFPRIPVPIQKEIEKKLEARAASKMFTTKMNVGPANPPARERGSEPDRDRRLPDNTEKERRKSVDRDWDRRKERSRDCERRDRERRRSRSRSRHRDRRDRSREKKTASSHRHSENYQSRNYDEDLEREKERIRRDGYRRSRERSSERHRLSSHTRDYDRGHLRRD